MRDDVLLKVYGHIWPVTEALCSDMEQCAAAAMGSSDDDIPVFERDGNMARISFEGIYFPADEMLEAIGRHISEDMQGKLDVLDLEAWRLTRHRFEKGKILSSSAPLNNVLDYSGH